MLKLAIGVLECPTVGSIAGASPALVVLVVGLAW